MGILRKGDLVHEIRDVPNTYKGQETIFRNIKGKWCPECGAGYFGLVESDELMAAMAVFNDQVDANIARNT